MIHSSEHVHCNNTVISIRVTTAACYIKHQDVSKYCLQKHSWMHVKNVCVQIYKYGYGREHRRGTVPEGATHQAGPYPTGERGGTGNRGVP
jgi:hypothetical protein